MKRILLTAAILSVAAGGQVLAADLPQPALPPPQAPVAYVPTVAPVYNWGGIYFGVNAGYGFGTSDWTNSLGGTSLTTGNFNVSGAQLGATLGANFQTDAFVFGVEGDFDASWLDGKDTGCSVSINPVACETKNTWLSTVRGRVGYAADRVLFYATAGGAFGDIQANTCCKSFQSKTEPGWTAGAGVEAAFADNWTARIEYLYVDLENASLQGFTPGWTETVKFNESIVRGGIDFKFR